MYYLSMYLRMYLGNYFLPILAFFICTIWNYQNFQIVHEMISIKKWVEHLIQMCVYMDSLLFEKTWKHLLPSLLQHFNIWTWLLCCISMRPTSAFFPLDSVRLDTGTLILYASSELITFELKRTDTFWKRHFRNRWLLW